MTKLFWTWKKMKMKKQKKTTHIRHRHTRGKQAADKVSLFDQWLHNKVQTYIVVNRFIVRFWPISRPIYRSIRLLAYAGWPLHIFSNVNKVAEQKFVINFHYIQAEQPHTNSKQKQCRKTSDEKSFSKEIVFFFYLINCLGWATERASI